jgi:H+/Cl- antiporter ClcA
MSDSLHRLTTAVIGFLKRGGLWWGVALSLAAAVVSFVAVVVIVVSWAPDRFKGELDLRPAVRRPLVLHILALVAKNVAGVLLVGLGLAMAVPGVPGQGLLTALIGLSLLSFPGKRRLERRLIRRPLVLRNVNRLRHRFHRPPLELD